MKQTESLQSFPFTKDKLMKMPLKRRYKWAASWLRNTYHNIQVEAYFSTSLFEIHLKQLSTWMEEDLYVANLNSKTELLEKISDLYHFMINQSATQLQEHEFLETVIEGDKMDDLKWSPKLHYSVALDNIRSAYNVGSFLRSADATGLSELIFGGSTPDTENSKVQKTSMSSHLWMPTKKEENLSAYLKEQTIPKIGIETVENAIIHYDFKWPSSGIIIFGNEEYGLSQSVMKECDHFVKIPMLGRKNSLNVVNSFNVILYEIIRSFRKELLI